MSHAELMLIASFKILLQVAIELPGCILCRLRRRSWAWVVQIAWSTIVVFGVKWRNTEVIPGFRLP